MELAWHCTYEVASSRSAFFSDRKTPLANSLLLPAMILMLFLLAAIMSTFAFLSRSALTRPIGVGLLTHTLFSVTQKSRAASCEPLKNAAAVSAVDLASNPLLQKDGLPKFKEIKSDHIVPALEHDLNKLKTSFQGTESSHRTFATVHILTDSIMMILGLETKLQSTSHLEKPQDFRDKSIQIDYANVVEQMERIQAPLSYSWSVVGHLMGVKNSEDLRKAHDVMQPSIIEAYQALGQSLSLYRALLSLKDNKAIWSGLEEAQQRIVESALRDMKNAGVALDADKREKFNKLQLEAAELSTKFSNNVLDSTKQFKLKLTKKEEVLGLPESALALAAQNAVQSGESDATAENGPWVVTLDFPSYLPVMQHLKDQAIREQVYRAYVTRASTGEHDNAKLIQRILQVKQEMAALLGYSCHADKSLSRKMASSVDQVMQLIEMLRDKSFDAALRDIQDVKDFAKQQGVEDELQLWDIPFWSERLREAKYEFEEEQLRAFFPLPVVLEGMFKLANRIFGIKIVRKQDGVQTWHEDVQFFDVLDANTNAYIASFFLDPYSRPSEKRGGAWMDVCLGRSKVLNRKPVAYLTCNGSPPVGDKPSLMTFREVETLFHEFGHGLQHMLTNVVHGEAAGSKWIEPALSYHVICSLFAA
ncbi:M3 family peptidase [archaeon]|nr:MAG: M3 family peptidase [archaeon]